MGKWTSKVGPYKNGVVHCVTLFSHWLPGTGCSLHSWGAMSLIFPILKPVDDESYKKMKIVKFIHKVLNQQWGYYFPRQVSQSCQTVSQLDTWHVLRMLGTIEFITCQKKLKEFYIFSFFFFSHWINTFINYVICVIYSKLGDDLS